MPVVTGLIDTPAGGVQIALQVSDDQPVILPLQDARQLAVNLTDTITARLAVTTNALGEDDPPMDGRS